MPEKDTPYTVEEIIFNNLKIILTRFIWNTLFTIFTLLDNVKGSFAIVSRPGLVTVTWIVLLLSGSMGKSTVKFHLSWWKVLWSD